MKYMNAIKNTIFLFSLFCVQFLNANDSKSKNSKHFSENRKQLEILNNRQINQNMYEEIPDYIEPNFNDKMTRLNVEITKSSLLNTAQSPKKSSLVFFVFLI